MHRPAFAVRFFVFAVFVGLAGAQQPAGEWRGDIEVPGQPLAVVVRLQVVAGTWTGAIDIPAQGAVALPLQAIRVEGTVVAFTIADTPGEPMFRGELDAPGTLLRGTFTQGAAELSFTLRRAEAAAADQRARFDGFGAWLDETRLMFEVPGCVAVVVKGGELVATFTSGQRDVANSAPVTADTLFAIGSSTKAFTTCTLAMLVEQGRLEWDAPVRRWLPEFTLADAVVGERLTPRDLVTHRSGMPRHDLVWYGANFERRELVARLRHLPLNHDLRTDFQYNNLMYLTAGHLAERITGSSWEALVRERILTPLGMQRTNFAVGVMQQDGDHALPYGKRDGKVAALPFRDITAIGPAGSINSSGREMANWVALHLQHGEFGGRRLLSLGLMNDLHTPRMAFGGEASASDPGVVVVGYALGWFVDVYRGHRRVHHGGNIDGFSALVTLLPDAGTGFVVLTNLDGTGLPELIVRHLAERALGLEVRDTRAMQRAKQQQAESGKQQAKQTAVALRRKDTKPSRPLAEFAGDYAHPGYGLLRIELVASGLRADLHGLTAVLEHAHDDVFMAIATGSTPGVDDMQVQFQLDLDGEVTAVRSVLEASVPAIVFTRAPDARLADPAFLRALTGKYVMESAPVSVLMEGDRLVVTLPGQRHELEPRRGLMFGLRGVSGYSAEFVLDAAGAPSVLRFRQPDGVYEAKRE